MAPLLISALLTLVLGATTWLGYDQLRRSLVELAGERTEGVAALLGSMMGESATQGIGEIRRGVSGELYADFEPGDAVRSAALQDSFIARLRATPQAVSREIRAASGACLLGAWRPVLEDSLAAERGEGVRPGCSPEVEPPPGLLEAEGGIGPLVIGPNRLHTWVAVRIGGGDGTGLYVVEGRRASGRRGVEVVQSLIAPDARVLLGNASGGPWSEFTREVRGPAAGATSGLTEYRGEDGGVRLAALARIPGTPWRAPRADRGR